MSDTLTLQLSELKIMDKLDKAPEKCACVKEEVEEDQKVDKENNSKWARKVKKEAEEEVVLERGVRGRVKWYNVWHHYGFIGREDDPKTDVFVHQSGIAKSRTTNPRYRTLDMGEEVVFDVVAGKGHEMKKAVNVAGPDGKKVRGCYFFEQYLRSCAYPVPRRRFLRGDARPRFSKRSRNQRKILDVEEKGAKRVSEKISEDGDINKVQKQYRSTNEGARDKKHYERSRHIEGAKEKKLPRENEKDEVNDNSTNEPVEAKIGVKG